MGKNLAFLFSAEDLESVNMDEFTLVPMTESAMVALLQRKLTVCDYNHYFIKKSMRNITKKSHYWAKNWLSGKDEMLSCFNLSLDHYFSKTLYNYECILNLIKKNKPKEIFIGDEQETLANKLFFNHESLRPIIFAIAKKNKLKINSRFTFKSSTLKRVFQIIFVPKITIKDYAKGIENTRILILANHYHIKGILALIDQLPKEQILLVGKVGETGRLLKEKSVRFIDFHDKMYLSDLGLLVLWKANHLFPQRFIRNDIYKYGGVNLFPIVKDKIFSVILSDSLQLMSHKFLVKRMLKKTSLLSLLALTNDSRNQIWIKLANAKRIPTFELQHGLNFGHDFNYQVANTYIAWGKAARRLLINSRTSKSKVMIGGWPRFDEFNLNKRIQEPLTSSKKRARLLFLAHEAEGFSTPYGVNKRYQGLLMLYRSLKQLSSGIDIKVRLHPRSNMQIPKALARLTGNRIEFDSDPEIINSLKQCDIVVGQTTTASLYGILSGKPTIYLPSMKWPNNFLERSGVYTAFDQKSLLDAISKIRAGRYWENAKSLSIFLSEYCSIGINSSITIANLLLGKK